MVQYLSMQFIGDCVGWNEDMLTVERLIKMTEGWIDGAVSTTCWIIIIGDGDHHWHKEWEEEDKSRPKGTDSNGDAK